MVSMGVCVYSSNCTYSYRLLCISMWASLLGQTVKNLPLMQETQVQSLGREDPLEKEPATHSSILAWRIPWTKRGPVGDSPWGHKESDVTERTNKLSLCAAHKHSISTVELTRISLCSFLKKFKLKYSWFPMPCYVWLNHFAVHLKRIQHSESIQNIYITYFSHFFH